MTFKAVVENNLSVRFRSGRVLSQRFSEQIVYYIIDCFCNSFCPHYIIED